MLNPNRRYASFNTIELIEGSSVPAVNQIIPSNFRPRSIQHLNALKHRQCPSTLPLKYSDHPFTLGSQPLFCLLRIPVDPFLHCHLLLWTRQTPFLYSHGTESVQILLLPSRRRLGCEDHLDIDTGPRDV